MFNWLPRLVLQTEASTSGVCVHPLLVRMTVVFCGSLLCVHSYSLTNYPKGL